MKKMTAILATLLMTIIILPSCSKSIDQVTTENISSGNLPNKVNGQVFSVDAYGVLQNNNAQVRVTMANTAFKADTTTNDQGQFILERIPAGNYTVTFQKEGYADYQNIVKVEAGKPMVTIKAPVLGPVATHRVLFDHVAMTDSGLTVSVNSDPAPSKNRPVAYRIFLNNDGPADHQHYAAQMRFSTQTGGDMAILTPAELKAMGIQPGQVHLTVYADTFNATEGWVNGMVNFPTLNTTQAQHHSFTF
jgi:hypothetical protein